jgi:hypothetical protein
MLARITQIAHQVSSNMATPTDIHLYTAQTPNGIKVSILLEELGLQYKVRFQFAVVFRIHCSPGEGYYHRLHEEHPEGTETCHDESIGASKLILTTGALVS